jgi:folate-binding protein YgfZ
MTDVERQWTALCESVGLYEDRSRSIWSVEGAKALDALHGLLTNDLHSAEAGQAIPCLALTPKGRPITDLRVWKRGAGDGPVLLDLSAEGADGLLKHFGRYLPPRFARIVPLAEARILRVLGPLAAETLHSVFGGDPELPAEDRFVQTRLDAASGPDLEEHAGAPIPLGRPESEGGGWDVLLPALYPGVEKALLEAAESAGGCVVGAEAWDIWRVERGIPVYGRDFGLDNLPQETGLTERTVSFDKGCYTGQEVVARIHYRGHVNQRLMGLQASSDAPLPPAAELFREEKASGRITSPVHSPRFGSIALGMIRREVDPGTSLSMSPASKPDVLVRTLPFTLS